MTIKFQTKQVIACSDWDDLVKQTYGRPYIFQQQDGCQSRGNHPIEVPVEDPYDYENDTLEEGDMGVSFKAWLEQDPVLKKGKQSWERDMYWQREFYPSIEMVANDLHAKGLLPAGKYVIEIDW